MPSRSRTLARRMPDLDVSGDPEVASLIDDLDIGPELLASAPFQVEETHPPRFQILIRLADPDSIP